MTVMHSRPIYCLGPAGTNAHQAALAVREDGQRVAFCKTNAEVMRLAATGRQVVVPIENQGAGGLVLEVINEWITMVFGGEYESPKITGEYILPISYCLMAKLTMSGKERFTRVMSHTQAFLQSTISPRDLTRVQMNSTAEAAKVLAEDSDLWESTLALATPFAAEIYHLNVLESCCEKYPWNATRFHILNGVLQGEATRTALLLRVKNSHGELAGVLDVFARAKMNISFVTSIDTTGKREYVFYLEVDANLRAGVGMDAVNRIRRRQNVLNAYILGAYPQSKPA